MTVLYEEKECYQYDLPKKLNCSYRTTQRLIKLLKSWGFARVVRVELNEKNNQFTKNIIALTPKGEEFLKLLKRREKGSVGANMGGCAEKCLKHA